VNIVSGFAFLLFLLGLALAVVYLVDEHMGALWSAYWGAIGLFSGYALFLAGWLITKHIRLRLRRNLSA
jgi:Flp pilus assembly protein protease CpaA